MKKTVVSVATLTAITGVAATAVSADEYTISSGDTLWGIANEVGTSVAELKADNELSSDIIFPGDVLTVNPEEAAPAPASNESSYIVKPGDTLWAIGAELSIDYNEIMKWNNLSSDLIFVGQELSVDGTAVAAPVVEEVPAVEEVEVTEPAAEVVEEPAVEEVEVTEPAAEVVEAPAVEEVEVTEPAAEEIAAAEEAEADRVAAEEAAAAKQAEADRVAAEEAAAAKKAAEEQAAAQRAAEKAAAEKAAEEQAAAQRAAEAAAAEKAAEEQAAAQRAAEAAAAERAAEQAAAEEAEEQPAAATPVSSASNGKNYYSWGTCAWYVFEKRSSMGMSVGNTWGDAKSWASNARSAGYSVNNTPSVGAVMQAPAYTNGAYGQGHVAIVERVNGDGSILVSEMQFGGGLGDTNTRTISASQVSNHNFIH